MLDVGKLLLVKPVAHREQAVGTGNDVGNAAVDARLVVLAVRVDQELSDRLPCLPDGIADLPALRQQVLAIINVLCRFFPGVGQQVMPGRRRHQNQQPQYDTDKGVAAAEAV